VYAVPVLNRGVGRDYSRRQGITTRLNALFEETLDARPMRICPQVARYVERNALRADLIPSAEEWR
jgi:hypothetical protein